jgi:hypothetical protein
LDTRTCEDIDRFLDANKLPILKKFDSAYIKKLQKEGKMAIIAAVDILKNDHRLWISTTFTTDALKNRDFVFTYIDKSQDAYMFNYFGVGESSLPQLIIYDFENRYHFKHDNNNVDSLISLVKHNGHNLVWSTGSWFDDFLMKFGIRLNSTTIAYILGGLFIVMLVALITIMLCCTDASEEDVKAPGEIELIEKKNQ